LRAELSTDQGEWEHALDQISGIKDREVAGEERARLKLVRDTCQKQISERHAVFSEVKSLEAKMEAAAERAKKLPPAPNGQPPRGPQSPFVRSPAGSGSADVIVYGTSWCQHCAEARAYLRSRKIAFVDKDVEKDFGAADELAEKVAWAGKKNEGSVPWIDARGTLVHGFDKGMLDHLLR
jgi:glutaredoxin